MYCPDKQSLTKKYNLYIQAYNEALDRLVAVCEVATRSEWELARIITSRAHQLCEDTLAQLQKHIAEHGCGTSK